jgi:hypothetical protein
MKLRLDAQGRTSSDSQCGFRAAIRRKPDKKLLAVASWSTTMSVHESESGLAPARLAYTVREAHEVSGLSVSSINRSIADGSLPSKLVRGRRIITRDALLRWLSADDADRAA